MKTVFSGFFILCGGLACFGQVSGPLSGTMGPGTYHVIDTIYVNPEDSLILMPATTFIFDGPFPFEIRGILLAEGIEGDSVVFTTDTVANPGHWRGLRFLDSTSSASSLAYCIIENGRATGGYPNNCGGGVSLLLSSPQFQHCAIRFNSADSLGGGVYCGNQSSPNLASCSIIGNIVGMEGFYEGGGCGVYCDSSSPSFAYCTISLNSAYGIWGGQFGGGIYLDESIVSFDHCSISGNIAGGIVGGPGGGIYCLNSLLSLTECTVSDNGAAWRGGGMDLTGSIATLTRCTISGNHTATDMIDAAGGGMACSQSTIDLVNCTFSGNSALGDGGGLHCRISTGNLENCSFTDNYAATSGGGILSENSSLSFENCALSGNQGFYGGAVYSVTTSAIFSGCSIVANSTYGGHGGGLVFVGGASATLTNCTINDNLGYGEGGGVHCNGASPTFTNCSINGNVSEPGPWSSGIGGGVYCYGPTTLPIFANCSISSNTADSVGGGVACQNGAVAVFDTCTMSSNSARYAGGGVYCHEASPIFTDCSIDGDTASSGGGVFSRSHSSPIFSTCMISNNSVEGNGGGVACYDSSSPIFQNCSILDNRSGFFGGGVICSSNSSPSFTGCAITNNHSGQTDWAGGGGTYCGSGSPAFVNCVISDNVAFGDGGGIYCSRSSGTFIDCKISNNFAYVEGGGILCEDHPSPTFAGCEIANNTAADGGGGIFSLYSAPVLTNCSVVGNSAYRAGGVFCYNSSFIVNSTIIAFSGGEGIYFGNGSESYVKYCDVFGNTGGDVVFWDNDPSHGPAGLGELLTTNANGDSCDIYHNIFLDPMFVDTSSSDYHLQEGSPCIDAGDPDLPHDPDSTIADIGSFYYHQVNAQVPLVAVPASYALYPNWPNPFNPVTTIRYDVKQAGLVRLTVFNVLGQRIATPVDGKHAAGSFTFSWDAANLPSGTYLCRMEAPGFAQTRKMFVVK